MQSGPRISNLGSPLQIGPEQGLSRRDGLSWAPSAAASQDGRPERFKSGRVTGDRVECVDHFKLALPSLGGWPISGRVGVLDGCPSAIGINGGKGGGGGLGSPRPVRQRKAALVEAT